MIISKLEDFIDNYEGLLVDIWGVVHNGVEPYPGVTETINDLLLSKKILFLSNTPRPSLLSFERFKKYGININENHIYTSGDLVREQLKNPTDEIFNSFGKKLYHLGAEKNQDILKNIEADIVEEIDKAEFVLLTAYLDEDEDFNKHNEILEKIKNLNLPVICANPDTRVYEGNKLRFCAGTIAKIYEDMGGEVHYYGKPDSKIYIKALEKLSLPKSKILMIGDNIHTDIKGAYNIDIDSAMVLTGNGKSSLDIIKNNPQITPTWIINSLSFI